MDLNIYIQFIFFCSVNTIFTFSGIVLNTLVMASIWKSAQLRKKLCHFMIMVLSWLDLLTVITNYPPLLLFLIFWLRKDFDLLPKMEIYICVSNSFIGFSFLALLVMSIERYLGTYYPIFHRTSVTRRRLLTLLAVLLSFHTTFFMISNNDIIISRNLVIIIWIIVVFCPLVYLNFKLFTISRQIRRRKGTSLEKRTTINLKSISTCLLVVACLVVLSISTSVSIVFDIISDDKLSSNGRLHVAYFWALTTFNVNCTLNSLIFFWKNKVLRTEGIKILKTLKDLLRS